MARPKSASDGEILQAAHRVIARRGYEGFSLAEVAREVGISRSAIIQRFESTRALKVTLTNQMIHHFRQALDALPVSRGGDGLIALAAFIGSMISARDALSVFMQNFQADLKDEELSVLERERTEVLVKAISLRMPDLAIEHDSGVMAFMAHMGGSLMQWQFDEDSNDTASEYLAERIKAWLTLAGIPYDKGGRVSFPQFQPAPIAQTV